MEFNVQDYYKNEVWKTYSVRPDPELDKREKERFILFFFLGFISLGIIPAYWTGQIVLCYILVLAILVLSFARVFPVKCPKCDGPVLSRRVEDENDPDKYFYWHHDCPECEISWRSKKCSGSSSRWTAARGEGGG